MLVPGAASVMGTRLWDQIIRLSLNKSAVELFYYPLEPALRRHAKAVVQAGLERVGDGGAAVPVLAGGWGGGGPAPAPAPLVVVAVGRAAGGRRGHGSARGRGRTLGRLRVDEDQATVSLRERSMLRQMVRLLDSPYERVVLHAMDLLEDTAPRLLESRLPQLL